MVISTGISSFDQIIGGSLPPNSITLIDEDVGGNNATTMLRYFLAEGIMEKNSIFLASLNLNRPQKFISELPAVINDDTETEKFSNSQDDMKIAFRYHTMPQAPSLQSRSARNFDLTTQMPQEHIDQCEITIWQPQDDFSNKIFKNTYFEQLLQAIKEKINNSKGKLLRLALHSIGSPLWLSQLEDIHEINLFIYSLRALIRFANVVAYISVPSYLFEQGTFDRCLHCSDVGVKLQQFAGTDLEHNKSLSEYHGFFLLTKLAAHNSFVSKHPGCIEYAFKLRRKKFVIEVLSLPPDLDDDGDTKFGAIGGCCGPSKKLLDF